MELGIRTPELERAKGIKRLVINELRSLTQVWTRKERREKKNNNSAGWSEACPITISRDPGKGTPL